MKRILKYAFQWLSGAGLCFTVATVIYAAIAGLTGERAVEIKTLASLLLLSATGTLVQFLCFTDGLIRNMRYTRRLLLFGALFLPLLAAIGALFGWFPARRLGAWLGFLGIAMAVFAAMTLFFEVCFHLAGRKYDGLLGQYRKRQGEG